MSKKGLGRGLGALLPEADAGAREGVREIEIAAIGPNLKQPRKVFDQGKLEELASSIREHGVVQPIVVRPVGNGFEIVAGERRWRASQLAGLKRIPAVVRELSETEVMEIALIENLQRADLNPLEEAEAYRVLLEEFHLTQDELAKRVGRSRPQISNTLRLLQLCADARAEVEAGRLSMGHAKVLLGVANAVEQGELAKRIVVEGLSVRELEGVLARGSGRSERAPRRSKAQLSADLRDVERRLNELFGTPVKLAVGEQRGKIEITFFGHEGLGRILDALGMGEEEVVIRPREGFRV